ncbi:MAG: cell division protein FtsL [Acinetobacter sp.]|nr:cell division protein FtsL [Acinetobacter sp.]
MTQHSPNPQQTDTVADEQMTMSEEQSSQAQNDVLDEAQPQSGKTTPKKSVKKMYKAVKQRITQSLPKDGDDTANEATSDEFAQHSGYSVPWYNHAYMTYSIYVLMLLSLMLGALMVISNSHHYRTEYQRLYKAKQETRELDIEWGKMLIEKQTFGSSGQIAARATHQLNMYLPRSDQRVLVTFNDENGQLPQVSPKAQ